MLWSLLMMKPLSEATIFVAIAAYRDPQLPLTLASLFAQAQYPDRVHVGVFNQIHLQEDQDCVAPNRPNVLQHVLDYSESQGACWARSYVWKTLLADQDFALQIDSHSRFAPHWDTSLLQMFAEIGDARAVITHYPMGFDTETDVLDPQMYTYFNVQSFRPTQLPEVTSGAVDLQAAPKQCDQTAFIAAGSLFGRADMFKRVPYDPYIYFHGEEITYAARLWTHGYNLYLPNRPYMWHDYKNLNQRPLHWQDHKQWALKDELAQQRCRHLLRIKQADDVRALKNLEQYGLGFERSLDEYQVFAGLNFRRQTLEDKAKSGKQYG